MIKRFTPLIFLLFFFINADLYSQTKAENKMNFHDAESWILFEDFREALPIYQELIKYYPDNSNFKYRIGQCYINMPGEKEKAITYLEQAVKNINPGYREGRFSETGAPYDALYYLANAYRINNQLDKALETYKRFKQNLDTRVYDTTIVDLQIQSCHNAKMLMESSVYIIESNLGNSINESTSEFNPVISDDENMMVFSKSLPFYDAILYSTKANGTWTEPRNMNELLKVDRDIYPASLSKDGQVLYLYNSINYDGDIFSTTFENGYWSPIVKLNDNINTKYWESHAAISHDNKKLYFTSNRKNSIGGLDIYVSKRDITGDWGPPLNLGPVINTPYNEETPFLSEDDRTLFFSSRGHFNMGGHDIFYSTLLENGEWSLPLNAGYPLNSTDDDIFFKPVNKGYEGYFAKFGPDGFGRQDIYRLEIFSDNHPRKFLVNGVAKIGDLALKTADSIRVSTVNIKHPDQTSEDYTDPETGEYELLVTHGDHKVTYEAEGSEMFKRDIHLPLQSKSDNFIIPPTILAKTDFVARLSVEVAREISTSGGDSLMIPLKVEPNSVLTVEHRVGDSLLFTEQFTLADSVFNYKMLPLQGESRVTFRMMDKYGNTASEDIFIARKQSIDRQRVVRPEYPEYIAEKKTAALSEMKKPLADEKVKDNVTKEVTQAGTDESAIKPGKGCRYWYIWLLAGAGLIFLFIILRRKKNKDKEKD